MLLSDSGYGFIAIDDSVIVGVVADAANECFGVAGMAAKNMTEGFLGLFKKDSHDKGISVDCTNNDIVIDLHIMVTYGINIPAITESIVHKVTYSVEQAVDFKVKSVNVFVDALSTK